MTAVYASVTSFDPKTCVLTARFRGHVCCKHGLYLKPLDLRSTRLGPEARPDFSLLQHSHRSASGGCRWLVVASPSRQGVPIYFLLRGLAPPISGRSVMITVLIAHNTIIMIGLQGRGLVQWCISRSRPRPQVGAQHGLAWCRLSLPEATGPRRYILDPFRPRLLLPRVTQPVRVVSSPLPRLRLGYAYHVAQR